MSDAPTPRCSIVIPVRNEEQDVEELARRIAEVVGEDREIIFVDDGSTDGTWEALTRLHAQGLARAVRFRRNFGKAAALMAGFREARGKIVFTLDGDLQDDPAEIPRFIAKLEEGHDLVCGWKRRRHDPWHKVLPSRLFNFTARKATGASLHDMNCGFKLFQGDLARRIRIRGELHRYIPALAAHQGYRIGEIEVRHHPRRHGRSKYGLSRLFKGFLDLLTVLLETSYRDRPAHAFGWAALAVFTAALGAALVLAVVERPGGASVAALGALMATILAAAGFVAEIVVRHRTESAPETLYVIGERLD